MLLLYDRFARRERVHGVLLLTELLGIGAAVSFATSASGGGLLFILAWALTPRLVSRCVEWWGNAPDAPVSLFVFAASALLIGATGLTQIGEVWSGLGVLTLTAIMSLWVISVLLFESRLYRFFDVALLATIISGLVERQPGAWWAVPIVLIAMSVSMALRHLLYDVYVERTPAPINVQSSQAMGWAGGVAAGLVFLVVSTLLWWVDPTPVTALRPGNQTIAKTDPTTSSQDPVQPGADGSAEGESVDGASTSGDESGDSADGPGTGETDPDDPAGGEGNGAGNAGEDESPGSPDANTDPSSSADQAADPTVIGDDAIDAESGSGPEVGEVDPATVKGPERTGDPGEGSVVEGASEAAADGGNGDATTATGEASNGETSKQASPRPEDPKREKDGEPKKPQDPNRPKQPKKPSDPEDPNAVPIIKKPGDDEFETVGRTPVLGDTGGGAVAEDTNVSSASSDAGGSSGSSGTGGSSANSGARMGQLGMSSPMIGPVRAKTTALSRGGVIGFDSEGIRSEVPALEMPEEDELPFLPWRGPESKQPEKTDDSDDPELAKSGDPAVGGDPTIDDGVPTLLRRRPEVKPELEFLPTTERTVTTDVRRLMPEIPTIDSKLGDLTGIGGAGTGNEDGNNAGNDKGGEEGNDSDRDRDAHTPVAFQWLLGIVLLALLILGGRTFAGGGDDKKNAMVASSGGGGGVSIVPLAAASAKVTARVANTPGEAVLIAYDELQVALARRRHHRRPHETPREQESRIVDRQAELSAPFGILVGRVYDVLYGDLPVAPDQVDQVRSSCDSIQRRLS